MLERAQSINGCALFVVCLLVLRPNQRHKSYFFRFIVIKFAKPSWRTLQTVILSVTNPTGFVVKCDTVRICSPWKDLPPRNTLDHFAAVSPGQNSSPAAERYFSFLRKKAPWKFHEPTERDTGFPANAAAQTGAGTSFGATGDFLTRAASLYLFLRLNNSETFAESWFWAQR